MEIQPDSHIYERIQPLLRALKARNVTPFIGAGLSRNFGYPSWSELLNIVSQKIYNDKNVKINLSSYNNLHIAEGLLHKFKPTKIEKDGEITVDNNTDLLFNELIIDSIKDFKEKRDLFPLTANEESEINDIIKLNNLPFHNIITTNYDDILENTIFKDMGYNTIFPRNNREFGHNESNKAIYKIHGDLNYPNSIILTNSQYYNFMNDLNYFKSKVYTLFASTNILMLGYGFSDINIHDIYFRFQNDYKDSQNDQLPKIFLVIRNSDRPASDDSKNIGYELYKTFLEKLNFIIIDDYSSIGEFILNLTTMYEEYSISLNFSDIISDEYTSIFYNIVMKIGTETTRYFDGIIREIAKNNSGYFEDINVIFQFFKFISILIDKPELLYDGTFLNEDNKNVISNIYDSEDNKLDAYFANALFQFVIYLIDNITNTHTKNEIYESIDYKNIVLKSLEVLKSFASDFNYYTIYIKSFILLSKNLTNFTFTENEKENIYQSLKAIFSNASFRGSFGASFDGGRYLEANLERIPLEIMLIYLEYSKKKILDKTDFYSSLERRWLKYIKDNDLFNNSNEEVSDYIDVIING